MFPMKPIPDRYGMGNGQYRDHVVRCVAGEPLAGLEDRTVMTNEVHAVIGQRRVAAGARGHVPAPGGVPRTQGPM